MHGVLDDFKLDLIDEAEKKEVLRDPDGPRGCAYLVIVSYTHRPRTYYDSPPTEK